MATYKGIAVVKDLAAGATVHADRAMLQQVVGNLLSNAIRYTVRGSITVRSRLEAGGVRVEVEDTGIGMTPEDQARIFEEFFQVDGTHRAIGEGYGLGLAVAKRMAALMGGDLSVTSEPGKGSRFTLSLPPSVLEGRPVPDEGRGLGSHLTCGAVTSASPRRAPGPRGRKTNPPTTISRRARGGRPGHGPPPSTRNVDLGWSGRGSTEERTVSVGERGGH